MSGGMRYITQLYSEGEECDLTGELAWWAARGARRGQVACWGLPGGQEWSAVAGVS